MAILRATDKTREFPLRNTISIMGRDAGCDIVVQAEAASRRHAMIVRSGDAYYVEDLNSINGTFLNGKRVRQRTRLDPGDRLEIPGLAVSFHLDEPQRPSNLAHQVSMHDEAMPGQMVSIHASLDMLADSRLTARPEAKLRAILELSKNLANILDVERALPKILDTLFTIFVQADRGFILLRDEDTGQLLPKAVKHRQEAPEKDALSLSRTIIEVVVNTGKAVLSSDARSDGRFDVSQSIRLFDIRSIMCVPLLSQSGQNLGIVQIDTQDRRNPFKQDDLDVLISACDQASRALQLARLHYEQREWTAATQIQKSFLPAERPIVAGLTFFDYYATARQVGGDYYDYIHLPGNRFAIALGDVSGKGVAAALLMARLSAAVRFCLATEPDLAKGVQSLSRSLTNSGTIDHFITFLVIVIDLADYNMTLVNAGHLPPLLKRVGTLEVVEVGNEIVGLPLAVIEDKYDAMQTRLEPGDVLVLYTDGVTEARNRQRDLYGFDRLRNVVAHVNGDPEAIGQNILDDVRIFAAGRAAADDLTLVCFGRGKAT